MTLPAFLAPLALQSGLMVFDEWHFHRRRAMPRWERIGHPIDTLTVLFCIAWVLLTARTPSHVATYVALAAFSCVFVTKDEVVHSAACGPGEHWLHALLYLLHPVCLACVALLWPVPAVNVAELGGWLAVAPMTAKLLVVQFALTAGFCGYQALYWNWPGLRRSWRPWLRG